MEPRVTQVRIKGLKLQSGDHSLIDKGSTRQGGEVGTKFSLSTLAQAKGQPVEVDAGEVLPLRSSRSGSNEELFESRHRFTSGLTDDLWPVGNVPPAENMKRLAGRDCLNLSLLFGARPGITGQERNTHRIRAHCGKLKIDDITEKTVGNLGDDASTIARARVRPNRPAVFEVAQGGEGLFHDVVSWGTAQGCDHRQAAGVFVEGRVIKSLCLGR